MDTDEEALEGLAENLKPWSGEWSMVYEPDPETARNLLRDEHVDALVVSVHELDSPEADFLREVEEAIGTELPVVVCTPRDAKPLRRWALQVGASDFVDIPADAETMVARLRTLMRLRSVQEELRARNVALRETEERYSLAARGANDGIWDWKVEESEAFFSPRWKVILGYDNQEIGERIDEWIERIHPEDRTEAVNALRDHLAMRSSHYESEHRLRKRDGSWLWVRVRGQAVWDSVGRPSRMAGSLTDISRSKETEERLVYEATHDVLTGLYNRRHAMAMLNSTIHSAKRYDYPVSVCLCDLDRFKHINDTYGHPVGDEVLSRFGKLLTDQLRAEDMPGRYGGDEFIIVFPHVVARDAACAVERIRRLFAETHITGPEDKEVTTSATFGLCDLTDEHAEAEDLVAAADAALYEAKEAGRNRVYVVGEGLLH